MTDQPATAIDVEPDDPWERDGFALDEFLRGAQRSGLIDRYADLSEFIQHCYALRAEIMQLRAELKAARWLPVPDPSAPVEQPTHERYCQYGCCMAPATHRAENGYLYCARHTPDYVPCSRLGVSDAS